MKSVTRILNKMSVKIITSIILLVTIIIVMNGIFAFQAFTKTMINEATLFVDEIAESIALRSENVNYSDLLDAGSQGLIDIEQRIYQLNKRDSLLPPDPGVTAAEMPDADISGIEVSERELQIYYGYLNIVNVAMAHLGMTGIKEIEVIIPQTETYYSTCKVIYGQNESEMFELGDERKVESKKLKEIIERIWTGEVTEDTLMEYSKENPAGDIDDGSEEQSENAEITICKALTYNGSVNGILMVRRSVQNIVSSWNRYVIGITILGGSLVLIGTLLIGLYLRVRVVKPVNRVTMEAERFARENVIAEQKLAGNVGKITEIRVLAGSIDKMEEGTMKNMEEIEQMSRESERIDTELSLAANLQMSVLPKGEKLSGRPEFDVAAKMNPAREVGGDFYDFFFIDDTHLVLLIADVSDKGVGAAFFMAVSKTLLKARASMGGSPAEIVTFAEEKLSEENEAGMFITAWLGIVDLVTGEVKACNAGHNFPAVLRADTRDGYRIDKTEHGPPICFLPGVPHVEYSFRLSPGDRIFLYTDGVTEAKNPEGERFGNDRLVDALNDDREIGNDSLILRVKAAVDLFAGEEAQYDDMTMVSFTYLGAQKTEPDSEPEGDAAPKKGTK